MGNKEKNHKRAVETNQSHKGDQFLNSLMGLDRHIPSGLRRSLADALGSNSQSKNSNKKKVKK